MANLNSVKIDNIGKEIAKILEEYKEDIEEEVKEISDQKIKLARNELRTISPKNTGNYAKSWTTKVKTNKNGQYSKVVYNKEHYRLTHLLEFGHATRNGGRTKAIPHIRPTEQKYKEEFVNDLKQKIKNGG